MEETCRHFVRSAKKKRYFHLFFLQIALLLPHRSSRRASRVGGIHNEKDVYLTFCLWRSRISQILRNQSKQSNGRCLRGVLIATENLHGCGVWYIIHIGVGFCVAYPDWFRQCESLGRGISSKWGAPLFCYV